MMGNCNMNKIKEQSMFCMTLMDRLDFEIQNSKEGYWSGMESHTRKQDDIKRIRRELLTLSKMLNPWEG